MFFNIPMFRFKSRKNSVSFKKLLFDFNYYSCQRSKSALTNTNAIKLFSSGFWWLIFHYFFSFSEIRIKLIFVGIIIITSSCKNNFPIQKYYNLRRKGISKITLYDGKTITKICKTSIIAYNFHLFFSVKKISLLGIKKILF